MSATTVVASTDCSGRVAEWQTRWLQVPVSFGTWGFKSPFAHKIGDLGGTLGYQQRFGAAASDLAQTRSRLAQPDYNHPLPGIAATTTEPADLDQDRAPKHALKLYRED